jgi:hypothetical protein
MGARPSRRHAVTALIPSRRHVVTTVTTVTTVTALIPLRRHVVPSSRLLSRPAVTPSRRPVVATVTSVTALTPSRRHVRHGSYPVTASPKDPIGVA